MLILTRKAGQKVTLEVDADKHDRKIVLKILEVRGTIVRLGLEADSYVRVESSHLKPPELWAHGAKGEEPDEPA